MRLVYSFLLAAIVGSVYPAVSAFPQEGGLSTEQVLEHHLQAFGAGDVDAIVSDYSEEAVIFTPSGMVQGQEDIRAAFETLVAEFSKPGMSFEMVEQQTKDEIAYIVWTAETADNVYEFATDTFVIRDGKIVYQSYSPKTEAR
jgi:ketosteroid isomerase-like protein